MATKTIIVVTERRRMIERPIRTVCAWCAGHDRPATVLVDVPIDGRGLSHGICPPCRSTLLSGSQSRAGLQTPQTNWR
jgi:hypothetical protein